MKESLRLNIPTPCTENWDAMLPAEQGRHCQECCKTVVDFTEMSDAEVLSYFKDRGARGRAGRSEEAGGVCGRFMADQLRRELAPAPVQRNGAKGWPLVVASALVLGKGPDGGRPVKAGMEVRGAASGNGLAALDGEKPDTSEPMIMGKMMPRIIGTHDSVVEMPADTVTAVPVMNLKDRGLTGLVRMMPDTMLCSRKPMDTVSRIATVVDTVVNMLKDSVAALVPGLVPGARRGDVLNVYPNPVMRGGMIRLAWRGEAGTYAVAFLNLHGQITQERMIEVGGKGQIDEWAVPNGLAAGVYFLRVTERSSSDEVQRPGAKAYTVEVLVR